MPIQTRSDQEQIVTFRLGSEIYGVPISRVREVLHYRPVMHIPNSPAFVEGVIQVRDQVIPVVDMRRRLQIAGQDAGSRRIVILDLSHPLGIVVDDISRVLRMGQDDYEELPEAVVGNRQDSCINRLAKTDDGLVIIISANKVLDQAEKEALAGFAENMERERQDATGAG